jgi:uncharacterized protein (DUF2249 family)
MNTVSVLTPETSFAVAIMNDETLFERLVAYNRGFHKFSRVVMREDVASQLALGDLASMAGVPSADVLAVAGGGAPETAAASPGEPAFRDSRGKTPHTFDVDTHTLDVRSDLDHGQEPLATILGAVAALKPGQDLVIETTFHAVPLRRLLSRRGFVSLAEQITDDHWRIRFRRSNHGGASCCGRCGGNG